MLERLAANARKSFAAKPLELVWATKDPALGREEVIARWLRDFPTANLTRLADASHYIQVPDASPPPWSAPPTARSIRSRCGAGG
jgi:hypothetical protein